MHTLNPIHIYLRYDTICARSWLDSNRLPVARDGEHKMNKSSNAKACVRDMCIM